MAMAVTTHSPAPTQWAPHAFAELERAGFRKGGARSAVVQYLAGQHCAVTAATIESALRDGVRGVGRASVYRVLEQLTELGLVSRVEVGQNMARFEAISPNGEHHHHMVCDDCGTIVPFEDPALERSIQRLSERTDFTVSEHEVVLRGACGDCGDGVAATQAAATPVDARPPARRPPATALRTTARATRSSA